MAKKVIKRPKCYFGTNDPIKVGHLVIILTTSGGNNVGSIVKVTKVDAKDDEGTELKNYVMCESKNSSRAFGRSANSLDEIDEDILRSKYFPKTPSWYEHITHIRRATEEDLRKQKKFGQERCVNY